MAAAAALSCPSSCRPPARAAAAVASAVVALARQHPRGGVGGDERVGHWQWRRRWLRCPQRRRRWSRPRTTATRGALAARPLHSAFELVRRCRGAACGGGGARCGSGGGGGRGGGGLGLGWSVTQRIGQERETPARDASNHPKITGGYQAERASWKNSAEAKLEAHLLTRYQCWGCSLAENKWTMKSSFRVDLRPHGWKHGWKNRF